MSRPLRRSLYLVAVLVGLVLLAPALRGIFTSSDQAADKPSSPGGTLRGGPTATGSDGRPPILSVYPTIDAKGTRTDMDGDIDPGVEDPQQAVPVLVNGMVLAPYADGVGYFTLNKPKEWLVELGDAILVSDQRDNGITEVRLQPIHLSGTFRELRARELANYIVGNQVKALADFHLEGVREAADGSLLELVFTSSLAGVPRKGVIGVFVNAPYAFVGSYVTWKNEFEAKEPVLRAILASYRQANPPVGTTARDATPGAGESDDQAGGKGDLPEGIGPLRRTIQTGGVKMALPEGWGVLVLPSCSGLIATDPKNPARDVVFMNGLHQGTLPLPAHMTPESYLTDSLPDDFKNISDVRILHYEDVDLSALSNGGTDTVKSMRVALTNTGVPSLGTFTVGTFQTGGTTAVAHLWAITGPAETFLAEAPTLLRIFGSIDYSQATVASCRQLTETPPGMPPFSDMLAGAVVETQKAWDREQADENAIMERFGDAILDRERVYQPKADAVFQLSADYTVYYGSGRGAFERPDLRQFQPDAWLEEVPLDGRRIVP